MLRTARGTVEVLQCPLESEPPSTISGAVRSQDFTHLLHLDPDPGRVHRHFSKGRRHNVKHANSAGITYRIASTDADVGAYYELYQDTLRRWGTTATSRYPRSVFDAALNEGGDSARLWLAELDGIVVAGEWIFSWGRHTVEWHAAILEHEMSLQARSGLLAAVIDDACLRGMSVFDFNPSGGHTGTANFKRHFGAKEHQLQRVQYDPRAWRRVARRVRGRLRRGPGRR